MKQVISARSAVSALIVVTVAAACSGKPPENKDYASRLIGDRQAKDAQFRDEDEPVPKSRKAKLLPLAYFADRSGLQRPGGLEAG